MQELYHLHPLSPISAVNLRVYTTTTNPLPPSGFVTPAAHQNGNERLKKKQEKREAGTNARLVEKSDETQDAFPATTCRIFVYKR